MHSLLRIRRDRLMIAAIAFVAANLLHGFDHQRTGPERLTAEVTTGGALVTLAAIGALWLVWRRSSSAPAIATLLGFWSAALVAQAHLAPHWSALSDSYWDLSPDAFSWSAAAVEALAAVALGLAGLRRLRADREDAGAKASTNMCPAGR